MVLVTTCPETSAANPHFPGKNTEAQRKEATWPRSHSGEDRGRTETSSWPSWGYRPHNISPRLGPFLAGEVQGRSTVLLGTSHQGWARAAQMTQ